MDNSMHMWVTVGAHVHTHPGLSELKLSHRGGLAEICGMGTGAHNECAVSVPAQVHKHLGLIGLTG